MICITCSAWEPAALCRRCRASLRPAVPRRLPGGLLVGPAFCHEGAARRLVHLLKYGAVPQAAALLAEGMVDRLPPGARAVVPVPRARVRQWSYGVDPAARLAEALATRSGLPVVAPLAAAWWWPRHAGRARSDRRRTAARFAVAGRVPAGAVLVDDVLTTGETLAAAAAAAAAAGPLIGAVTATAAGL
jgi:predicted amidophosphoribosyltransferase